jgi:DNA-binding MurR/RpiR family transcriptional regulator
MVAQGTDYAGSPIDASIHRDLHNLQAALETIDPETFEAAAKAIATAPYTLCVSSGSYSGVGLILAHLGAFMGYPIVFENRGGAHLVSSMSRLRPGDCVVAISFWRTVKEVTVAARHARAMGITTVGICDSAYSPLAQAVEHALIVPTESVSFFQSMTAATSLVYGLLARLQELGGARVDQTIRSAQAMYAELVMLV